MCDIKFWLLSSIRANKCGRYKQKKKKKKDVMGKNIPSSDISRKCSSK